MEMIVLSLKQMQIISASFDPEVIMLAFMLKSNLVMRFYLIQKDIVLLNNIYLTKNNTDFTKNKESLLA